MKKVIKKKARDIKEKDIPKLNYGIIHSQVGFNDGVSIVMKQIESVMVDYMGIQKSNIYYLVGRSKYASPNIRQRKVLWHNFK